MKRKIFSKLLMGAFLFASVSAFVSCKDYDDDINANKAEIKAVQDQLTTLTSNLNSLKTELQTQKTALQQELATAKSQLETQIADAKAQLTTAIEKKADQATVDALATRVANLETNLAALNAAYEAKMAAVDSALASLQAIIDKKADITYVDNAIAILNSAIEGKVAKEDFGAFKSEVNTLQNDLNNLTTLVNSKADQKDIDHAVEKINEKLAALAEQMKTTVPQSDIANMQETIKALQDHVNSLIQAVTAKVEQSAFDQLNAFYKELKEQVNTLVTPEQLASAIATLKEEIEKKGAEESARLDEAIAKVQKAVDDNKAAGDKALKDAVDEINTALGTKASVDDLTEAKKEFNKAIEELNTNILAKLAAVSGDITKTNEKIDEINEALDAKIKENAKNLSDFETAFGKLNLDERVAACEALIEQVDAINLFLGELKEGGLAKILKDLQKEMSEDAAKKVAAEAEDRAKAIEDVYTEIGNVQEKLNNEIAELNNKLYGEGEVKGDIDKLKADTEKLTEDFSKIDEKVQNKVNENLSNLVLFVSRSLKSISLVPQLFIGGIEAIEFTSLQYYAIQPGTSGLTTRDAVAAELKVDRTSLNYKESQPAVDANKKYIQILTDNGLAEAYYRLNPSKVDRSSIDEDNIEFLAATAETRAASVESPVEFNGIAEWPAKGVEGKTNGLIKVNLRKTAAYRNKSLNQDPIFIVALKMPRKATKVAGQDVEAADIVSENSRLAERVMIPKIARLEWNTDETKKFYDADKKAVGNVKVHHYTDSVTMWAQRIDKTELVYDSVEYNKSYDVLSRVTGCDVSVAGKHTPISKEDLKKYGLTFRFGIPTKAYNDVDHSTDQQQFASIDPVKGIVTSKIPNNEVNNRACVGKEPIIRIMR